MVIFYESAGRSHIQKERDQARRLKVSVWWKRLLSQGRCYYCGKNFSSNQLTMDHKVPLARGGRSTKSNIVVSCKPCNFQKQSLTSAEWIMASMECDDTNKNI